MGTDCSKVSGDTRTRIHDNGSSKDFDAPNFQDKTFNCVFDAKKAPPVADVDYFLNNDFEDDGTYEYYPNLKPGGCYLVAESPEDTWKNDPSNPHAGLKVCGIDSCRQNQAGRGDIRNAGLKWKDDCIKKKAPEVLGPNPNVTNVGGTFIVDGTGMYITIDIMDSTLHDALRNNKDYNHASSLN